MTRQLPAWGALITLAACTHHPDPGAGVPEVPLTPSPTSAPAPRPITATLPAGLVQEDADDAFIGPRSAPMAVLEWSDIQCPYCGPSYGLLAAYVKEHEDVRLVLKHYPISGQCNPNVDGERHEHACAAARAVICANQQGRFDALAGLLFANQATLADPDIDAFARQADVYNPRFTACLQDPATAAIILRDVKEAEAANVQGTPTIFVHGVWGPRWVQVHGGASAVMAVLDAARAHEPLPVLSYQE